MHAHDFRHSETMPTPPSLRTLEVIDSHTEGEPTRVVVSGGPDLGPGSATERLELLRRQHDDLRTVTVLEPRGTAALVGALLLPPQDPEAVAQVIFFNNVDYLGMCVHGTLGVARTLQHLGRVGSGRHRIETPVGDVTFEILEDDRIRVENVPSYRHRHAVAIETAHHGTLQGDIAYGGNWFFLVDRPPIPLETERIPELTDLAWDLRQSLEQQGMHGRDGGIIDHIELFAAPQRPDAHSKNFVLCPGREYDRSPCGTGTSAKMACLVADGKLGEGQAWRQESILGSLFEGTVRLADDGTVIPSLTGGAYLTAHSTLWIEDGDPYSKGIQL